MFINRCLLCLSMALLATQASAQIYRCESGDSIIFSDQPCSEEARVYQPSERISVVAPAEGLSQAGERNRQFISERRERQQARRQSITEQREQPAPPQPTAVQEVTRVLYIPEPHRSQSAERSRRAAASPRQQQAARQDERPFSALHGPFPGTRQDQRRDQ